MADDLKNKPDDYWKRKLSEEQFNVCRLGGTEAPFSGKYADNKEPGVYQCAACGQDLFSSGEKFDSGTGWPSFYEAMAPGNIEFKEDSSHSLRRTEVLCSRCASHLGHIFDDGPKPTGKRYCINSTALNFVSRENNF